MGKTIANVMKGSALLLVKTPDTQRAEWSTVQAQSGDHSVKLSKGVAGDYGSTHVRFTPTGAAAAKVMSDFEACAADWGWSHFRQAVAAYWEQMELRFEDPLTGGWVVITVQVDVMETGAAAWAAETLTAAVNVCMFGGWSETAGSFADWTPATIDGVAQAVEDAISAAGGSETNTDDWVLTRVKMELWETVWKRYVYVDDVIIAGQTFTLEPGNATSELVLSSDYVEVGYTEDGVTFEYIVEEDDTRVDEESFPIDRDIVSEGAAFICSMAEATMANMNFAMAGSVLSGATLKLGAGVNKKLGVQIIATNPASFYRSITMPSCTANSNVSMAFKRAGQKTLVPVRFEAIKTQGEPAVTVVENAS